MQSLGQSDDEHLSMKERVPLARRIGVRRRSTVTARARSARKIPLSEEIRQTVTRAADLLLSRLDHFEGS